MKRLALAPALLATALIATACGSPAASQPAAQPTSAVATPSAAAQPAEAIDVVLVDFKIEPSTLSSGSSVVFNVSNDGPTPHNLTIRDGSDTVVLASPELREGESAEVAGELTPAEYTIFCSLPGHESLGMRGTLTVAP